MLSFNLSALAVRQRSVTLFFIMLSLIGGLYAFLSLGRAEDPAFTVRVMMVSVIWPGAAPQELQDQVVDRLEKRIQEVEYLYRIETSIRPGRADLQVEFHDHSPSDKVPDLFYEVRKRMLDETRSLPDGVIGPIVNDDFSDVYFSLIALTSPGLPLRDLTRVAEPIRDRLQQISGVQKAMILAERTERVFLEFDTDQLMNLDITAQQIFAAIDAHNRLLPAGKLESAGPRIYLRLDNNLAEPEKLATVPLRIGDRIIRLQDVATIHRGYEDPPSYLVRAGGEDALLLGVVMQRGENGLLLGEQLAAFIEKEQQRLPLGISMQVLTNQSDAIVQAVNLFQVKFLMAVAVVMAVSILAIGLRAGLVVGIAIPLTLGLTFLLMLVTNINLDRVTLGALIIALGLLVDDAIIATEMMIVKMSQGWDRATAAAHAWTATAAPMLFGTMVTISGFVPIGFARSGVGEYAGNIFWVLAFALLTSWLVAVTFTPYLGVRLLTASSEHKHEQYDTPLYQRLRSLISWCVLHRKTIVFSTVAALIVSVVGMATVVQKQFFPSSDRPEVLVGIYLPQGIAIARTDQTTRKLETILKQMPEVKSLSAYVGAGAPRFFISANPEQPDPAFAKIIAVAHDIKSRDAIMAELEEHITAGEFPEARVRVQALLYGPPVIWPVSFKVIGPDPAVLRQLAYRVRDIMQQHPSTYDTHLEWDEQVPAFYLNMEPEQLRLFGLTPSDVASQLQFQLEGTVVTELRQDIRTVELHARGIQREQWQTLELKTEDGRKVPLMQLGSLDVIYEAPVIKRYNREPFLAVNTEIRNAQPNDVTMQLWQQLATIRENLPDNYRITIAGSMEESGKADSSIQKLQPVMVVLMLMFIMLQMRTFSGTFMVLATAPLGLIGAVLALLLFNQAFGFVALLGLIGLAGILMRNTLILTQQVSDNLEEGMTKTDAVIEAAVQRARPVILTALAAALAFVPLTFDGFWGPLAYVLIGGVLAGTVITLLFVPALYALWFRLAR